VRQDPLGETIQEGNLLHLGMISICRQLPPEVRSQPWEDGIVTASMPGRISCKPDAVYGVPHGLDNDVASAVHTAFMMKTLQGVPDDGEVRLSGAELLRLMGQPNAGGRAFAAVQASCIRLASTRYEITARWFDASLKKTGSAFFNYFSEFSLVESQSTVIPGQVTHDLVIKLNSHVISNIRAGHYLAFTPESLAPLLQPTARSLARMLECLRRDPQNVTHRSSTLNLSVQQLRSAARILGEDQRSSRVIRVLEPGLALMRQIGSLDAYAFDGRGENARLTLDFPKEDQVYDTLSYELLVANDVWELRAKEIAAKHSRAEIAAVVAEARDQYERGKVRKLGGFIKAAFDPKTGFQASLTQRPPRYTTSTDGTPPAERTLDAAPGRTSDAATRSLPAPRSSGPQPGASPASDLRAPTPPITEDLSDQNRMLATVRGMLASYGTEVTDALETAIWDGDLTQTDLTSLISRRLLPEKVLERTSKKRQARLQVPLLQGLQDPQEVGSERPGDPAGLVGLPGVPEADQDVA